MNQQDTTKIYRIEVPGIEDATSKVQKFVEAIALSKAVKLEAQKILAANPQDTDNISKQTAIIAQNEVALKRLNAEKQIAQKQADLLIKAAKDQALADTNTAAASLYAAGSYNALYASYKQLANEYRNTPKTDPLFEQIKQSAMEAKAQVDDFNRSLSPDGTLVGEYKSGILNAFKELGLTDVIKGEKEQISKQLKDLAAQNEELAAKIKATGDHGTQAFGSMEAQLTHNIQTQEKLKASLGNINATLGHTGSIGKEITQSIKEGFGQLITAGLEVAGITIGLREAFDFLKDSIKEFEDSDRIAKQLQGTLDNLGRSDALSLLSEQVDNLRQKFHYLNEFDIKAAQQKLIDFGRLTANQIGQVLPIIADMSARTGRSISDSTEQLIRALEGGRGSLVEFGIKLSQNADFSERLSAVLGLLKDKVDGAAEAFEKSAAGGIADTKEQIRELKEEIGKDGEPALSALEVLALKAAEGFAVLGRKIKETFDSLFNSKQFFDDVQEDFNKIADLAAKDLTKKFTDASAQEIADEIHNLNNELSLKSGLLNGGFDRLQKNGVDVSPQDFERTAQGIAVIRKELEILFKLQDEKTNKKNDDILGLGGLDNQEAEKQRQARIAAIDQQSADEQTALEKKKLKGELTEEQYQKDLFAILKDSSAKKIAILETGTTKEIQQAAQAKLQLIKEEQAFTDKMFGFAKDRIEAKKALDDKAAQEQFDKVNNDPLASNVAKAEAQERLDKELIKKQENFNAAMTLLELQFSKLSQKNLADRANALKDKLNKLNIDLFNLTKEGFQHILDLEQNSVDFKKSIIDAGANIDTLSILKDSQRSDLEKQIALIKLKGETAQQANDIDIDSTKKLITYYVLQYGNLVAYNKEFQKLLVLLHKYEDDAKTLQIQKDQAIADAAITNPSSASTQSIIGDKLKKLLGLGDDVQGDIQKKLLGEVIAGTFNTAQQAMNDYFDAEKQRIDASNKLVQKRLDIELTQRKAQAQSQAEQAALDKEYAAKKDAADRDAFEKNKKIQRAQAELNLGTELANIAVIATAPGPANLLSVGTFGQIMYGVLAALSLARFADTMNKINSSSFAMGGSLDDVLSNGGVFGGRPHAQGGNRFLYKGRPVETEAREAYVINKVATNAQGLFTVTGSPKQIASAVNSIGGGRNFAPGAMMYRRMEYGGSLGDMLQAPQNPGSYLLAYSGGKDVDELKSMVGALAVNIQSVSNQTNERIDNIKVYQVTQEAVSAQRKYIRHSSIGNV